MATVTILENAQPVNRVGFLTAGAVARERPPGSPIAKIIYQNTFTVTAKDAANETVVSLNFHLPNNFYYKCLVLEFFAVSTGVAAFTPGTGLELGVSGSILIAGNTDYRFLMYNEAFERLGLDAFKIDPDSVTSDFGTYFTTNISKYLIEGQTSSVRLEWLDTSDDATANVFLTYRAEFLQYTVEQAVDFYINTPVLTFS